jgi:hypothetical protein
MPVTGPKPSGRSVSGNTPRIDWVDIENFQYSGPKPELPLERQAMLKNGEVVTVPMGNATIAWWDAVSLMPHCVLWTATDWQFALDTSKIHSAAQSGSMPANVELRQREKIMGTTYESRRDLRIRYVEPEDQSTQLTAVASMAERRQRLLDA